MRHLTLSLFLFITFFTGCAMPPRLQAFDQIQKDSSQSSRITLRSISTDTMTVKPKVNHTAITFGVGRGEKALLMNNPEFCYNKTRNEIWLQNPEEPSLYTSVNLDSIRVCKEQIKGSARPYFVRNRALFWPIVVGGAAAVVFLPISGIVWIATSGSTALMTEVIGTGVGIMAGLAPAVFFSNTDGGTVRPDYEYCDAYYPQNELTPWLEENRCTE